MMSRIVPTFINLLMLDLNDFVQCFNHLCLLVSSLSLDEYLSMVLLSISIANKVLQQCLSAVAAHRIRVPLYAILLAWFTNYACRAARAHHDIFLDEDHAVGAFTFLITFSSVHSFSF